MHIPGVGQRIVHFPGILQRTMQLPGVNQRILHFSGVLERIVHKLSGVLHFPEVLERIVYFLEFSKEICFPWGPRRDYAFSLSSPTDWVSVWIFLAPLDCNGLDRYI